MTATSENERRLTLAQVIAIAYTVLLTYLLLVPDPLWFMPETGDAIDEAVEATTFQYAQHVVAYMLLTAVLGWAFAVKDRPVARFAFWPAVVHGISTEWLQQFIPERYGAWRDVFLNIVGIALGWLAIVILMRFRAQEERPVAGAAPHR